jgi:hypothetical protein
MKNCLIDIVFLFLKVNRYSNFSNIFIKLTNIQLLETVYEPVLHKCQSFPNANSPKESFAVCVAMTSEIPRLPLKP